ncbi:hypothetical protein JRO89_XS04G0126000 [Xanthoceras sorbifolium]|uniref:GAG-pre-integrase domain-containing protein n=1 Tax=Xanthoceras sorbifolium TaxID=99658 RepID=A0ABQ8I516_9ROSI|nr:hypothetical protein JRO89_XS04G0126000 [Xanthoceras sorbifolium]
MVDNSFPISWNHVNHVALVSRTDDSDLWHKRYGHFNMKALRYLQSHDMIRDMPLLSSSENVDEAAHWNWEINQIQKDASSVHLEVDSPEKAVQNKVELDIEELDAQIDSPLLKTKSLAEIYERCSFVINEPSSFEEASMFDNLTVSFQMFRQMQIEDLIHPSKYLENLYLTSKAAVETMVKVLAKELKGTGITANCVAPGPIATDMFFDGKTGDDEKGD